MGEGLQSTQAGWGGGGGTEQKSPSLCPPVLRPELPRTPNKWGLLWHQNSLSDSPFFNKREAGLLINVAA